MAKQQKETFIGTDIRLIISNNNSLFNLVRKYAALVKDLKEQDQRKQNDSSFPSPSIITQREIEDVLCGPMQHFFRNKLAAYGHLMKLQMHLNLIEDETLKERYQQLPEVKSPPEEILKNHSLSSLKKIQRELDSMTVQHEKQWKENREHWVHRTLEQLEKNDLFLSELEIKEFEDLEPMSELLDRFTDLNIELPKTKKTAMNFSIYLTLKSNLTIHSALSRQHLPHAQADIQKILNKMKNHFNELFEQETALNNNQKKETEELIKELKF